MPDLCLGEADSKQTKELAQQMREMRKESAAMRLEMQSLRKRADASERQVYMYVCCGQVCGLFT